MQKMSQESSALALDFLALLRAAAHHKGIDLASRFKTNASELKRLLEDPSIPLDHSIEILLAVFPELEQPLKPLPTPAKKSEVRHKKDGQYTTEDLIVEDTSEVDDLALADPERLNRIFRRITLFLDLLVKSGLVDEEFANAWRISWLSKLTHQ